MAITKKHITTQRAAIIGQVLANTAQSFASEAAIPVKVGQACVSGYSFFTNHLNRAERGIQALQSVLSLANASLLALMLFEEPEGCCSGFEVTCTINLIIDLSYQGILIGNYLISERQKDREVEAATPPLRAGANALPTSTPTSPITSL